MRVKSQNRVVGWRVGGSVLAGGCVPSITLNHGPHHGQMLRVSSAGQGQCVVSRDVPFHFPKISVLKFQ